MKNVIVFIGSYKHQIPFVLGFFGKENLEYLSEFDAHKFENSNLQLYYHKKLNSDIIIYSNINSFLNQSNDLLNEYNSKIFCFDSTDGKEHILSSKISNITNSKKVFIWYFGEVFEHNFVKSLQDIQYDYVLLGANRNEIKCDIDYLLPFKYFRYYIGYYWIENLVNSISLPKYDKNKSKVFTYSRANNTGSWRENFLSKFSNNIESKNSANDAYDLVYPKYKHFETIFDYTHCNINLIFETIDYRNNDEWFLTEKTFKGLFFAKPFYLVAPTKLISLLKKMGFYLINFEFGEKFETAKDLDNNFESFKNWIDSVSDDDIEKIYNNWLEKSKKNKELLFNYLNDYSQSETIFQKLLNN